MVENDYLVQERSVHDKRSIRVRLSEKGIKLMAIIDEMFKRHDQKNCRQHADAGAVKDPE